MMPSSVARNAEFPEPDSALVAHASGWIPWDASTWLLPLAADLPALVTPWVRLIDYAIPGYVETEVPGGWVGRLASWEHALLRLAAKTPRPTGTQAGPAWPEDLTQWKKVACSWCRPSVYGDCSNGRWKTRPKKDLPVFVGPSRQARSVCDELVPGQWMRMRVQLLGWLWDGHVAQLAMVVDQVLLRQTWQEDVAAMASRAMESARSALLIGAQEEKILSLLDISSR